MDFIDTFSKRYKMYEASIVPENEIPIILVTNIITHEMVIEYIDRRMSEVYNPNVPVHVWLSKFSGYPISLIYDAYYNFIVTFGEQKNRPDLIPQWADAFLYAYKQTNDFDISVSYANKWYQSAIDSYPSSFDRFVSKAVPFITGGLVAGAVATAISVAQPENIIETETESETISDTVSQPVFTTGMTVLFTVAISVVTLFLLLRE